MKIITRAIVLAALVTPLASFAQTNAPVTRAQVKAELIQLEKAGYNPAQGEDPNYPADIQAAEARVAAQNAAQQAQAGGQSVGGVTAGSAQSGNRVSQADWNAMYNHP